VGTLVLIGISSDDDLHTLKALRPTISWSPCLHRLSRSTIGLYRRACRVQSSRPSSERPTQKGNHDWYVLCYRMLVRNGPRNDEASRTSMDIGRLHGRWLALQVKPRRERLTAELLFSRGYEAFFPTYSGSSMFSFQKPGIALFPGYVFSRFDASASCPLITTPGVLRIVGVGSTPTPLEDREVDSIKILCKSGLSLTPHVFLAVGHPIEIKTGPLKGLSGTIVSLRGSRPRLIVSVHILQRSVSVESELAQVGWATTDERVGRFPIRRVFPCNDTG
jgi:transcription termination/antitermination protein NusG